MTLNCLIGKNNSENFKLVKNAKFSLLFVPIKQLRNSNEKNKIYKKKNQNLQKQFKLKKNLKFTKKSKCTKKLN